MGVGGAVDSNPVGVEQAIDGGPDIAAEACTANGKNSGALAESVPATVPNGDGSVALTGADDEVGDVNVDWCSGRINNSIGSICS